MLAMKNADQTASCSTWIDRTEFSQCQLAMQVTIRVSAAAGRIRLARVP